MKGASSCSRVGTPWETAQSEGTCVQGHWTGEHVATADTPEGHVTRMASGYIYQSCGMGGISPEPELYKCNTIPILVNIANINQDRSVEEIHCQSPSQHWVQVRELASSKYWCVGSAPKSHHPVTPSRHACRRTTPVAPKRRITPYASSIIHFVVIFRLSNPEASKTLKW